MLMKMVSVAVKMLLINTVRGYGSLPLAALQQPIPTTTMSVLGVNGVPSTDRYTVNFQAASSTGEDSGLAGSVGGPIALLANGNASAKCMGQMVYDYVGGNLVSNSIIMIQCDNASLSRAFGAAVRDATPNSLDKTCAIFYSLTTDYCNTTNASSDMAMFTAMSMKESAQIASLIGSMYPLVGFVNRGSKQDLPADAVSSASLSLETQTIIPSRLPTATPSSAVTAQQVGPSGRVNIPSSSTTAVAMIVLYVITGIVTFLFLFVVISGAVRAARNPHRYGPRARNGRRQTRAKGLARAVLDTFPIMKFGEPRLNDERQKDSELAPVAPLVVDTLVAPTAPVESVVGGAIDAPVVHAAPIARLVGTQQPSQSSEHNIDGATDIGNTGDEEMQTTCPICTEDFARGEDLRVLPCKHRYHPVCVDPWLLNVSGQCPLCRTDFNPPTTVADACTESDIIDPDRREYVPRANQGGVGLVLTNSRNPFERYLHLVRSRNSGRHPSDVVDMHTLEGLRQEMNRNHHHHSTRRPLNRMFSGSRRQQEGPPHSSAASRTTEFPAHEQPFHAFGHMIGPP